MSKLLKEYIAELLIEKRRQDKEGVPREGPITELLQYVNKGYFVHFSDLNKVGINPRSHFNTPTGIYTPADF